MTRTCIGRLASLVVLSLAFGAVCAAAQSTACDLPAGATMRVFTYFGVSAGASDSPLCNRTGPLIACRLAGWFYQPSGVAPFPAVVINHSNENPRQEADYCPIVEYFVGKGYVVFEPVRRGFSGDAGLGTNTGELPDTTLAALVAGGKPAPRSPYVPTIRQICTRHDPRTGDSLDADCANTELQANQSLEVNAAVSFLRGLNGTVHPNRIALIGHAGGANITLMSATQADLQGVKAGVLLSPGERIWGRDGDNAYLKARLYQSMRARFFSLSVLQPRDAESVGPTQDLAEAAITTQDFEFMVSLLPAVGADTNAGVQRQFATRARPVGQWAPLAWRFISINGVK